MPGKSLKKQSNHCTSIVLSHANFPRISLPVCYKWDLISKYFAIFSEVTKVSTLARKGNWNFVGKKNQYESAFSPHSISKSNFGVWITVKKLLYLSHKGASITRQQPTNECRAALKYQILWRWTFLIVVLGTKWRTKKGIIFEKRHWMWGRKVKKHFIMTDEDFLWRHTLAAYPPSEFHLRGGD